MITSILLGAQAPLAPNTKLTAPPTATYADTSRQMRDDDVRTDGIHAIDVDAASTDDGSDDVIGSPIYFVDALLDVHGTIDNSRISTVGFVERDEDQDGDGGDEDDLDGDWPLFVSGTDSETGRELRLYVDDGDGMSLGFFGGCSSTVKYAELERQRVREPIETVSFYL